MGFICDLVNYGLYIIGGKMNGLLRSSSFWMGIIVGVGWLLAQIGVVPSEDFSQFITPALVYIMGRLVSAGAKKAVKPSA